MQPCYWLMLSVDQSLTLPISCFNKRNVISLTNLKLVIYSIDGSIPLLLIAPLLMPVEGVHDSNRCFVCSYHLHFV